MEEQKIVLVASVDDDLERTKLCVESILKYTNPMWCEVVCVVDSQQRLVKEWLLEQDNLTIVEAEPEENYAMVRNYIINLYEDADVFLLRANCALLPETISNLVRVLVEQKDVAMVATTDYREAGDGIDEQKICFDQNTGILLRRKEALDEKLLDEHFATEKYCLMDFAMRQILSGQKNVECKSAPVYQIVDKADPETLEKDKKYLIDKWGFNIEYYNGVRTELIAMISERKEEAIRVLEIGCGTGATLLGIKKEFPNAEVYGLELQDQVALFGSKLLDIECGNIEHRSLNFPEGFFDYIICGDVLEHLVNPEDTLLYLRKFLKVQGHILASIPNLQHYSALIPLLFGDFEYYDAGIKDRTHLRFFTRQSIQNMFMRLKYEIVDLRGTALAAETPQWVEEVMDRLCAISPEIDRMALMTLQYCVKVRKSE